MSADTGAGTALLRLSGRGLLQFSTDIPNYAAPATTPQAGTGESLQGSACLTNLENQSKCDCHCQIVTLAFAIETQAILQSILTGLVLSGMAFKQVHDLIHASDT